MADIEVNVESTNRQIDINLSSPSDIDTSTKERGPAGSSGSSGSGGGAAGYYITNRHYITFQNSGSVAGQ